MRLFVDVTSRNMTVLFNISNYFALPGLHLILYENDLIITQETVKEKCKREFTSNLSHTFSLHRESGIHIVLNYRHGTIRGDRQLYEYVQRSDPLSHGKYYRVSM